MTQLLVLPFFLFAGWERGGDIDGFTVESRTLAGTKYQELRVATHSPLPPARIFSVLWNVTEYPQFAPYVKSIELLKDSDERIGYVTLDMPVVQNRDYTVLYSKAVDNQTRVHQMFFKVVNELGPPPRDGFVRIQRLYGTYSVEPADDGGSEVMYQVFSDPAGALPAFIVNGRQAQASVAFMRAILNRAARR